MYVSRCGLQIPAAGRDKPDDYTPYKDNYSESELWNKIKKTAKKAGAKAIYAALCFHPAYRRPIISAA